MKAWYLALLVLMVCVFSACEKPKEKQRDTFSALMGEGQSSWSFVKSSEDLANLAFFEAIYEKEKSCKADLQNKGSIPKVIHFIWLGPSSFPEKSAANVVSWIEKNPGFKCKFWTDRFRPRPHEKVEMKLISDFQWEFFKHQFGQSTNWAEKSDLLRYEILHKEGGIYVDHDVLCLNSFNAFTDSYDLFCGMEPPHKPVLSSSISVCNNLIGARPGHPVLKKTIDGVLIRWDKMEEMFPGKDKESTIMRIAHRTFSPFEEGFKAVAGTQGTRDIAFPAAFFNNMENKTGKYAHHFYDSTWFDDEPLFEKNMRRRLIKICRKNNQILLFNGLILLGNLVLVTFLLQQRRFLKHLR